MLRFSNSPKVQSHASCVQRGIWASWGSHGQVPDQGCWLQCRPLSARLCRCGLQDISRLTILSSLHYLYSSAAVRLIPHSTSPALSSTSTSSPPLLSTIGSTAKTFSCNSSSRSPTSSTSVRNQKRSYLRLDDHVWSYWASYELLTECMFKTCQNQCRQR